MARRATPGIRVRHGRSCGSRDGRRCSCRPSYEAFVPAGESGRKLRRSFPTEAAAIGWRRDALREIEAGRYRPPSTRTVRDAAEELVDGIRSGAVRTRSGDAYKPSVAYGYANALELHVLPRLGARRLAEVTVRDVQALVDEMSAAGANPATIRNALLPLRVLYRRALALSEVTVSPVVGVQLPAVRGRRERFATPEEAARLIVAAPERDRALWATAFYAGLRRGELQALTWSDVDLSSGGIRVRGSFDRYARADVPTKTAAGERVVPIPAALREQLERHRTLSGGHQRVFATATGGAFDAGEVYRRARQAWAETSLEPITLHEARHTFASLMAAAGVPIADLSDFMGHTSINVTMKRYRHLYPDARRAAASALDAYLARADTSARVAQVESRG
jgi:integrase